ncbi:MAG: M12 family metallo-peptidase [Candidatus Kapaibacterium sp.]
MKLSPHSLPVLLILFCLHSAIAQTPSHQSSHSTGSAFLHRAQSPQHNDYQAFVYSSSDFMQVARSANVLTIDQFPISATTETGTLSLSRRRTAADANTKVLIGTAQGEKTMRLPEVVVFKGNISGEPNSYVTLCAVNNELIGSIRRADGSSYSIAPDNTSGGALHCIVPDKSMHEQNELLQCMTEEGQQMMKNKLQAPEGMSAVSKAERPLSTKLLEVRVAVECDTKFFTELNKDTVKSAGYALALISMASIAFEDDLNVTLSVPWLKIWTDAPSDPYNVNGDGTALTYKAQTYWKANNAGVDRDVVHVLTAGGGGGLGLIYNLGNGGGGTTVCNKDEGFSSSSPFTFHKYPTLDFTYGVYIVAHELGHNFGAKHSHNCFWSPALDTCVVDEGIADKCFPADLTVRPNPGSIMSYCPNVNLAAHNQDFNYYRVNMTFLPQIAAYMRAQIEGTSCITEPKKPTVILTSPRGAKALDTSSCEIRWKSSKVQFVSLEYSINSGASWEKIVSDIDAATVFYKWYLPVVNTKSMLVRVYDVTDKSIADTSIVPFEAHNLTDVAEESGASDWEFHPTISEGELTLEGTPSASEPLTVVLYSLQGTMVREWSIPPTGSHLMMKFDVADIPAGVYSVQLRGAKVYCAKTVIRR